MRWQEERPSENVVDQRGRRVGLGVGGGIGTLLVALVGWYFGIDPTRWLTTEDPPAAGKGVADESHAFVAAVLGSTEDFWRSEFGRMGATYVDPQLVMYSDATTSACGYASAAIGPFYCPADAKIYLDTTFFDDLATRFGAPGDFACAYVIAHEVGHHVQDLLGISKKVQAQMASSNEVEANQLSVRLELQADFYAGLWAHAAQTRFHVLDPGDLEEALRAANAIGDDRLQRQARGSVVPDSFTHGTSEQRARWFRLGFETGDFAQGDTFRARRP